MKSIITRANFFFAALTVAVCLVGPANAKYAYFDPSTSRFTMPTDINNKGAAVGNWFDGNLYHGFLRNPDGTLEQYDPAGAVETTPLHINDRGVIVGTYKLGDGNPTHHGFIRKPSGKIVTYDVPGNGGYTAIRGMNKSGAIAGDYIDQQERSHGFVRDAAGNFASFDPPNTLETYTSAIADDGTITGYYYCNVCGYNTGGFIRTPDGTITTFGVETGAFPVNLGARGVVGGQYVDFDGHVEGFLRKADGTVAKFVYPGTTCCTYVWDMNKKGTIAGFSFDAGDHTHAYQRTAKGVFTAVQPDKYPDSETEAVGINDSGQILGWYIDKKGLHGFVYTP